MDRKKRLNGDDYQQRSHTAYNSPSGYKPVRKMVESKSTQPKDYNKVVKPKSFYYLLMENGYISNPADVNSIGIFNAGKKRDNNWNRLKIDKMLLEDLD